MTGVLHFLWHTVRDTGRTTGALVPHHTARLYYLTCGATICRRAHRCHYHAFHLHSTPHYARLHTIDLLPYSYSSTVLYFARYPFAYHAYSRHATLRSCISALSTSRFSSACCTVCHFCWRGLLQTPLYRAPLPHTLTGRATRLLSLLHFILCHRAYATPTFYRRATASAHTWDAHHLLLCRFTAMPWTHVPSRLTAPLL